VAAAGARHIWTTRYEPSKFSPSAYWVSIILFTAHWLVYFDLNMYMGLAKVGGQILKPCISNPLHLYITERQLVIPPSISTPLR
jgi:hypothetical protein